MDKEKESLRFELNKTQTQVTEAESAIASQKAEIEKLNHIITEADSERLRQKKEYDVVINERDILGTQVRMTSAIRPGRGSAVLQLVKDLPAFCSGYRWCSEPYFIHLSLVFLIADSQNNCCKRGPGSAVWFDSSKSSVPHPLERYRKFPLCDRRFSSLLHLPLSATHPAELRACSIWENHDLEIIER